MSTNMVRVWNKSTGKIGFVPADLLALSSVLNPEVFVPREEHRPVRLTEPAVDTTEPTVEAADEASDTDTPDTEDQE